MVAKSPPLLPFVFFFFLLFSLSSVPFSCEEEEVLTSAVPPSDGRQAEMVNEEKGAISTNAATKNVAQRRPGNEYPDVGQQPRIADAACLPAAAMVLNEIVGGHARRKLKRRREGEWHIFFFPRNCGGRGKVRCDEIQCMGVTVQLTGNAFFFR